MAIKPIIAKSSGSGDFEIPDEGVYLARCFRMADVGTQPGSGMYPKETRKVYFWWELLADADGDPVKMIDGKPLTIMNNYTLSLNARATLRKHVNSWRGKALTDDEASAFDITKLLDKYCLIQVIHKTSGDRTYANVDNILSTKRTAPGVNPISMFTVEDPDMNEYANLPEFIQKMVDQAPESQVSAEDYPEDERPAEQPKDAPKDEAEIPGSELPF